MGRKQASCLPRKGSSSAPRRHSSSGTESRSDGWLYRLIATPASATAIVSPHLRHLMMFETPLTAVESGALGVTAGTISGTLELAEDKA